MAYNEQSTERQRFRSFCERYLIARAPFFDKAREEEDAYECMLRAKSIYQRLNAFSATFEDRDAPEDAANYGVGVAANRLNAIQNALKTGTLSPSSAAALIGAMKHKP